MRVLIVEDEPKLAGVLEQGLREQGHAVDLAGDGEVGLGLAELEPYDILVLDIMLPKLDGLTICRRLRSQGNAVPILFLTSRDAIQDRILGLDCGADDYLVKPFALSELYARIRALLRRKAGSRNPLLQVGALELDPGLRQVRHRGETVELTHKEYMLLETLLRSAGRVLTREEIASHIWDYDFSLQSNVVDVYVRSLRRKLSEGVIRTVRGFGYQLQAEE